MPDLIRYRVTERDIRDWLQENGYEGGSALLDSVELYAIKRPGWKKLFRFAGKTRKQSTDPDEVLPKDTVWGVLLEDERQPYGKRAQVILCDSEEDQQDRLDELSVDMLTVTKTRESWPGVWVLVVLAFVSVLGLLLIAMVKRLYE